MQDTEFEQNPFQRLLQKLERNLAESCDSNSVIRPEAAAPFIETLTGKDAGGGFLWRTAFSYLGESPNKRTEIVAVGDAYFKPAVVRLVVVSPPKFSEAAFSLPLLGAHARSDIEQVALFGSPSGAYEETGHDEVLRCTDGIFSQVPPTLHAKAGGVPGSEEFKAALLTLLDRIDASDATVLLMSRQFCAGQRMQPFAGISLISVQALSTRRIRETGRSFALLCNPKAIHFLLHYVKIGNVSIQKDTPTSAIARLELELAFTPAVNTELEQVASLEW